jgi:hypothetical protein
VDERQEDRREDQPGFVGEWVQAGQHVDAPSAPDAPDNLPTVPGWLWAMAGGGVVSCGLSVVLAGVVLVLRDFSRAAIGAGCVAAALALLGAILLIRAVPLVMIARRQR